MLRQERQHIVANADAAGSNMVSSPDMSRDAYSRSQSLSRLEIVNIQFRTSSLNRGKSIEPPLRPAAVLVWEYGVSDRGTVVTIDDKTVMRNHFLLISGVWLHLATPYPTAPVKASLQWYGSAK
eukprot:g65163.t1